MQATIVRTITAWKPYCHSVSGINLKFIPQKPATIVGTAMIAAHPANFLEVSFCEMEIN
jgi:hypothetical protein